MSNLDVDIDDLEAVASSVGDELQQAESLDELTTRTRLHLGKEGTLGRYQRAIGALAVDERPAAGQRLQAVRGRLQSIADERRAALADADRTARLAADRLDLTEVPFEPKRGQLHLVTQTRDLLEDVFVGMGFAVAEGPEVETDWHNFQALNIPRAHPARSSQDTLYLDWGPDESTLVRTQTSPVQIRLMRSQQPPIYAVMPGRVYRKDTPDARHNPTFNQIEGLVVDRGITFGHLAGTIDTFTKAYFGPDIGSRLRPAYFPFTEPSAEFEVTCAICRGTGCRTCSDTGWIELGGCGMVHPNVLTTCGIDPEEWSGFAFGFGIDRLAQMRHAIADMRVLLDNDIRFTAQF
jgi:phenylalanyl-tRNA synthetase alpha chain